MITSTNGPMELIIVEPEFLPCLSKSQYYYHTSSIESQNKTSAVKLRNHHNRPNHIHQQPTVSKNSSLTINESFPVRIKY